MKRKACFIVLFILLLAVFSSCSGVSNTSRSNSSSENSYYSNDNTYSTAFTNKYGTPTTKCAHSGCSNYIASSGDTKNCAVHSNRCKECSCFIDEDATWCMDCLMKAANSSQNGSSSSSSGSGNSSKGPYHSSNVKDDGMGPYYCYGKGNTCPNKTYNCFDLYCDSCDSDGDNIED